MNNSILNHSHDNVTPTPVDGADLGTRIRERLKQLGLSQIDLAEAVGRSQGWVSQVLILNAERTLLKIMADDVQDFERLVKSLCSLLQWKPSEIYQALPLPHYLTPQLHSLNAEQKIALVADFMLDPEVARVVIEQVMLAVQRYLRVVGLS